MVRDGEPIYTRFPLSPPFYCITTWSIKLPGRKKPFSSKLVHFDRKRLFFMPLYLSQTQVPSTTEGLMPRHTYFGVSMQRPFRGRLFNSFMTNDNPTEAENSTADSRCYSGPTPSFPKHQHITVHKPYA
jgi:hypothetical protein